MLIHHKIVAMEKETTKTLNNQQNEKRNSESDYNKIIKRFLCHCAPSAFCIFLRSLHFDNLKRALVGGARKG